MGRKYQNISHPPSLSRASLSVLSFHNPGKRKVTFVENSDPFCDHNGGLECIFPEWIRGRNQQQRRRLPRGMVHRDRERGIKSILESRSFGFTANGSMANGFRHWKKRGYLAPESSSKAAFGEDHASFGGMGMVFLQKIN
ncbi:hypothetical protein F0562_013447 [Nyssa sinensis]|uniref:Uncharacterized protein n=1 Tax=Nyssa sinensis TaxID=561372 RepID=A0A5J4ZQ56_9ASTE|nr:hypothetical protein F0562_013447 [Nyssa sinensis]